MPAPIYYIGTCGLLFGHLVHTITTRGRLVKVVFPTDLPVYRSAIYPQGMASKYGLGGRLTLTMLRFLSEAQGCKDLCKPSKPCFVGIHRKVVAEYSQMSTHLPRFGSFSRFLHHFVLAKLATSSVRLKKNIN